jgi:hypothetical protein
MNKIHGKTIYIQNGLSIQKLGQVTCFLQRMGSFFPCQAQGKKAFLSQSMRSIFCEIFCTCSPNSLGQDLTTKNAKNFFFLVWASCQK